jgi:3-oxoacyl-(acyl-carrier-protein) synthase
MPAARPRDFVSAHGTGTQYNDRMETIALKRALGARAHAIPVVSIKPVVGHTLGAAGALEVVASAKVLEHAVVPPTIHYGEADPECDLDYVPNRARRQAVRCVLSCSSAFGGNNCALVMAAP